MKDTYIKFRCSKEFKEKVEQTAKLQQRSLTNYIEHLVAKDTTGKYNIAMGEDALLTERVEAIENLKNVSLEYFMNRNTFFAGEVFELERRLFNKEIPEEYKEDVKKVVLSIYPERFKKRREEIINL